MRKVIVILLLGLLLFNWTGYRLFTAWLEQSSSARQDAQLDDDEYEDIDDDDDDDEDDEDDVCPTALNSRKGYSKLLPRTRMMKNPLADGGLPKDVVQR